ncbi:hypothetical protein ACLOJK_003763 [Asimina triloba]
MQGVRKKGFADRGLGRGRRVTDMGREDDCHDSDLGKEDDCRDSDLGREDDCRLRSGQGRRRVLGRRAHTE